MLPSEAFECRDVGPVLARNFRFARVSPKISGSATESPFSEWGGRFGCFSEGVLQGIVILVFAKYENKIPASLRSSDEHGLDRSNAD